MRIGIMPLVAIGLLTVAVSAGVRAAEPTATPTTAGTRVKAGEYVEIDAEGRANKDFTISVVEATPNILLLRGKNGWISFATYDAAKKEYRGSFEFRRDGGRGPGGKWADLYQVRVVSQDGVLRVEGKSEQNEMLIRAKPLGGESAPQSPPAQR